MKNDLLDPPVFLYVKTHNKTGLKYFGRTVKDPFKYNGSGKHWLRHIKLHGHDINTEIIGKFSSWEELNETAVSFSIKNDIVSSPLWANLVKETGHAGIESGWKQNLEARIAISENSKKHWKDPEYRALMIQKQKDAWTEERKSKHLEFLKQSWTEERREKQRKIAKANHVKYKELMTVKSREPKSKEHVAKVAAANRGKIRTEAQRRAISERQKGVPSKIPLGSKWNPETKTVRTENGYNIRKVEELIKVWECVETGERFNRLKIAVNTMLNCSTINPT